MGLFNELHLPDPTHYSEIQFEFGELWNYSYRLGEHIRPSDDLRTSEGRFEVSGIAGLKGDALQLRYFSILIDDGVLISANEIDEKS